MASVTVPTGRCAGAVTGPTDKFVTSIGCLSVGRCAVTAAIGTAGGCLAIVSGVIVVMTGLYGRCAVAVSSPADDCAAAIGDITAGDNHAVSDVILVGTCIATGCSLMGRRAVTDVCPVNFSGGGPPDLCAVLAVVKTAIIVVWARFFGAGEKVRKFTPVASF